MTAPEPSALTAPHQPPPLPTLSPSPSKRAKINTRLPEEPVFGVDLTPACYPFILPLHVSEYLTSSLIPWLISETSPLRGASVVSEIPTVQRARGAQAPADMIPPGAVVPLAFCLLCKFFKMTMKFDLHPRSSEKTLASSRVG